MLWGTFPQFHFLPAWSEFYSYHLLLFKMPLLLFPFLWFFPRTFWSFRPFRIPPCCFLLQRIFVEIYFFPLSFPTYTSISIWTFPTCCFIRVSRVSVFLNTFMPKYRSSWTMYFITLRIPYIKSFPCTLLHLFLCCIRLCHFCRFVDYFLLCLYYFYFLYYFFIHVWHNSIMQALFYLFCWFARFVTSLFLILYFQLICLLPVWQYHIRNDPFFKTFYHIFRLLVPFVCQRFYDLIPRTLFYLFHCWCHESMVRIPVCHLVIHHQMRLCIYCGLNIICCIHPIFIFHQSAIWIC